jgi:hypothetical protein
MPERERRKRRLTAIEAAELQTIRQAFADRPSKAKLLATGDYSGPMSVEEYLSWRKGSGDATLTRQLQAAIQSTGQPLDSIAQATGVAAPVLQRFMLGERGITLDTAGKLADYLGLSLVPSSSS